MNQNNKQELKEILEGLIAELERGQLDGVAIVVRKSPVPEIFSAMCGVATAMPHLYVGLAQLQKSILEKAE